MSLSAAKSRLIFARDNLDAGRIDGIESMLDAAEGFLAGEPDEDSAPYLAQIAAIRAEIAARTGSIRGAAAVPTPPTDEEDSRLRRAAGALRWARERRDPLDLSQVQEAERLLDQVRDEFKTELLTEIAAIRAEVAALPTSEDSLSISGARYKLKQAASWLESGYPIADVAEHVGRAEQDLRYVPEVHRAPVLAEIAEFRGQHLGGVAAAGRPVAATVPPPPAPTSEPTDDELSLIRRVRTALMWARDGHDESKIEEAERLLAGVREEHGAQYLPEIAEIRAEIAESQLAERIRSVTQFVDSRFGPAERGEASSIAYCFGRLGSEELRSVLPPAVMEQYQARLAAAIDSRVVGLRNNALERAEPHLRAIEEHLGPDLFVGLDEAETYGVVGECENLKSRAEHELWAATVLDSYEVWAEERDPVSDEDKRALNARLVVPQDDPALAGIRARLASAETTIAAALAVWRKVQLDAEVARSWSITRQAFEGWREETVPEDRRPMEPASLPLTHLAIVHTQSLLAEPRTIEIRQENADDPRIEAIYQEVEHELQAALVKIDAVFNRVLDAIERVELPLGESRLDKLATTQDSAAGVLIREGERSLAGSGYLEPYVARVRRINDRWQAEIADAIKRRQELYDRLSVEADAAWPEIVAATGATTDFEPADTWPVGRVVLLHQVYNRAGWEFNGCDFAVRWDGHPVGGEYADYVLRALQHAWYELKLDVNDRIRWDLVGVVEGPGKVGERTNRVVRDSKTNQEIGKIEEWPPVECTWLRIIALHAGPVAVGPAR
jgi:hypothetical protein